MNNQTHLNTSIVAARIFARLSPGSPFYQSARGRHAAFEAVLVPVPACDELRYAGIAYFANEHGEDARALISRSLFSGVPVLSPAELVKWHRPVACREFIPDWTRRSLENVVHLARSWVQTTARRGWSLQSPGKPEEAAGAPWLARCA